MELIEDIKQLVEKSKKSPKNPFRFSKKIGTGPRGGTNASRALWKCTAKNYSVTCQGRGPNKGKSKKFRIKPAYKRAYNKQYRAWLKKGAPGSKAAQARLKRRGES